jgi:hypothetical protein
MPAPQPPKPPSREEIIASIRQQNSGHLVEQVINLEADKAVLLNELSVARRRIAELERLVAPVEPADADAAGS